MASKIGILLLAFLSYTTLASGFFFGLPGFFGSDPSYDPFYPSSNDPMFGPLAQQRSNNRDNSVTPLQPGSNEEPFRHDKPMNGYAEPEHEPETVKVPKPEPVQESDPKPVKEPAPKDRQEPDHKPAEESAPNPGKEPSPKPAQGPEPNTRKEPGPKPAQEPGKSGLREKFYEQSCPKAENIVNETIHKHFKKDPSYAAAFVRLFFHDCYVTGCDASIFLDTTPSGEEVEKKARHNGPLVRGYEVVDDIKTQLEAACPGIVSCADILAFATRDSLVYTGVPAYAVEAGRRDARASLAKNVEGNLPLPDASAEDNIRLFQRKGMTLEDLVVLLGAHSVGSAHCSVVAKRFRDKSKEKDIDRGYWLKMQTMTVCASEDQDLPFDPYSHHKMDSRFYKELLTNKALIESDHNLARDPRANSVMKKLVDDQAGFLAKFTNAMKKLGETEVLVGDQGEIRKQCRAVN